MGTVCTRRCAIPMPVVSRSLWLGFHACGSYGYHFCSNPPVIVWLPGVCAIWRNSACSNDHSQCREGPILSRLYNLFTPTKVTSIFMRPSGALFLFLGTGCLLFSLTLVDAHVRRNAADDVLLQRAQLVEDHALTDLSLFTEARYTRHISQADLHSAFQDHPVSLEHFPSGSLLLPPQRLQP